MNCLIQRWIGILFAVVLVLPGCSLPVKTAGKIADSHFHSSNYAMQGISLQTLVDQYMGDKISRSVVFALPLQQKWEPFEQYAGNLIAPNYYIGPQAGMYYYSFVDAMLAMDYLKLSPADQARLDPMMVGFNPMDQYGVDHIKRTLLLFPGVFSGIGEFSVHKELVAEKISDDRIVSFMKPGQPMPPDINSNSKNSLYSQALRTIFGFAAEVGLIVSLHSDIYPVTVTHDGRLVASHSDRPYTPGMKQLCRDTPQTTVYWAHTGLGRFVKPTIDHLRRVADLLDACPNWYTDLSWDIIQQYIIAPGPDMPPLTEWAAFARKYQDRILWGSDTVIFTRNRIDADGKAVAGRLMPPDEYRSVADMLDLLWKMVGPEVTRKIRHDNHVRLFDAAGAKVRAWEAGHRSVNVWDLD